MIGNGAASPRRLGHGSILPLVTVTMTLLVVLGLLAVDLGHVTVVKSELRAAVDATCRAGASGLAISPAEARARAKAVALSNTVDGVPLALQDSDIQLGTWDAAARQFNLLTGAAEANANAIRVNAQLTPERGNAVALTFAPVFGQRPRVTVSAVAGFSGGANLVLVQDVTGSFADELADAKAADHVLLDRLYANGTGSSRFGIVAHTGWGQTVAGLQPVNTNYAYLSGKISGLALGGSAGMPPSSGTDIAAGLEQALLVHADPTLSQADAAGRVIVLVSDGEPNSDPAGSHPTLSNSELLDLARQRADEAWAQKIHVYVAFFNRNNNPVAAANVASLVRGKGVFLQTQDPEQLPALLEEIVRNLPVQLLD